MSKLKHYKGDGWEVKVKYDEECRIMLWRDAVNHIPCPANGYYITGIVKDINKKSEGNYYIGKHAYDRLTGHLDTLTAPKILNEHTFDNPNFKIRIWETEYSIGGETLWIRDGFKYRRNNKNVIIGNDCFTLLHGTCSHFGLLIDKEDNTLKEHLNYTYTDLYKALERAEQETSELTYETVVKELEGLDTKETLLALQGYEYCTTYVHITGELGQSSWANVGADGFNLFTHKELIERGLIKLRRVK